MSDTTIRMDSDDVKPPSSPHIDHGRFVPGALVGSRYRIVAMLGKGGMGEVYRADDLLLGQPVALKFLPRRVANDPQRLARLLGEVRIARQISHPNVCRVYDVGEAEGEHFISMEYMKGEDLGTLLHRIGRLAPDKGVQIARQICAGLGAAHDRGVLHRDLKPANVMIDERGVARITDFGLAALADSAEANVREGTPAYMAPEQLEGADVTARSDLYALGLVLYEIFTGRMLFGAKTIGELLEMRRSTTAIHLTHDIDPIVERVIQRCLADDPRERPRSAGAVAAALPGGDPLAAALAAGETPSPELVAAAGEHRGVRPAYAFAALVAVLALLALIVFWKSRLDVASTSAIHDSPEAMSAHARDLLARFGHARRPVDRAWSYSAREPVHFWYRESPQAIVPLAFFRREVFVARPGSILETDPPLHVPGEAQVTLDPDGRLLSLRVVPPETSPANAPPFDWNLLLDAARIDRADLIPVTPIATVTASDHRAAWMWHGKRVEAASLGGRPVSFEIVQPHRELPSAGGWVSLVWLLLIIAIVATLARRNITSGRADLQGAVRTGWIASISIFLTWLFGADHVTTTSEIGLLIEALAWSALYFVGLWLLYAALEPTIRRRWPHAMVSWVRVLRGQWRDPQVGRDVLAGVVGGCVLTASSFAVLVIGAAIRHVAVTTTLFSELIMLNGTRQAVGELTSVATRSVLDTMAILIFLVFVRIVTRRDWLAALVFWLVFAGLGGFDVAAMVTNGVLVATVLVLTRRFGYLAWVVAFFVDATLQITPVLPPTSWTIGVAVAGLGVIVLLAAYGFFVALAGRPLFTADFIEA